MRIFGVPITNLKPCSPSNVYIRDTFLHCSPALFHHLFSKVSGHHIVKVKIDGSLFYYTAILEPAISVKDQIAIMSTPAMEAGTFSSDISLIDEINSITTPILLSIESTPGYEEDSQTSQARMQQYSDYQRVLSHADSIMNNLFLEQVRSLQAGIVFYLYLDDDHQPIILKPQFGYNDGCFISVGIKTELEIIPVIPPKGIRLRVRAAPEGSTISLISEKEEIVKGFDRGHQVLISLQLNSILYKVEALISELPSSGWVWISSGPDKDQQISYTQHQWVTLLSIETIHRGPVRAKMHKELTAYDDMDILHDRLSREGDRITGTNTCSMILLKGEARGGKTTLILDYQNYGKSPLLVIQLQKLDRSQWLCQLSKLAEHVAPNCAIALDTFQDINPDDAQFILEKINILRYCWSCPIILVVESTSDLPPCFSNSPGWHPDGPVEIKRKSRLWCLSVSFTFKLNESPSTDVKTYFLTKKTI